VNTPAPATRVAGRGFTLIEVMIAVLILALGLLGLAAIVPVIVTEQRRASESTLGIAAGHAAQAYFESRQDFDITAESNAFDRWFDAGTRGDQGGNSGAWSLVTSSGGLVIPNYTNAYLWEPLRRTATAPAATPNEIVTTTGDITLWRNSAPAGVLPMVFDEPATISVGDRLWPNRSLQPTTGAPDDAYRPIFVWDFVGRRIADPNVQPLPWPSTEAQQIQLAVFVRRIDPGIRVGPGDTLVEILTDPANANFRLPVAVDPNGRATNNGLGEYSSPVTLVAAGPQPGTARNRIALSFTNAAVQLPQVAQAGQRLVDNLGNIYTVRGLDENDTQQRTVIVDPAVPTSVSANRRDANSIRQIVYTPQIPAAVHIFTLSRPAR
jgi:prepilin-type N-terminal cleavage/methylation domain-containing protein